MVVGPTGLFCLCVGGVVCVSNYVFDLFDNASKNLLSDNDMNGSTLSVCFEPVVVGWITLLCFIQKQPPDLSLQIARVPVG